MTQNQLIFRAMTNRSISIMNDNNKLWTTKLKTANRIIVINGYHVKLDLLAKKQGLKTSGATGTKITQRIAAGTQASHMESILKSYYRDKNDTVNYDIIDYSMTDFVQGNIENSVDKMQLIYDTAAAILLDTPLAFADYNMEATDMAELQADIDVLNDSTVVPSKMKSSNKTITKEILKTYALLRTEMEGLDDNIATYKKSQPEFVSDYTNGRRLVQVGVGHKTAEVALMPVHFESVLGMEYTLGDAVTIKNKSAFTLKWGFTNNPKVLPTELHDLAGSTDIRVPIVKDANGTFGHWLILHNANELDDVNATVLLAKG